MPAENNQLVWRDGEMIPFADASIHVLSHAAHRGSEVFDVLPVVATADGPAAVGLRGHVARFVEGMATLGMEPGLGVSEIEDAVSQTVAANEGATVIKMVAAWAEIAPVTVPDRLTPTIFVVALSGNNYRALDPKRDLGPISIKTALMPKVPASILPPNLKVAASYMPGVLQKLEAVKAGFDDVLFMTETGDLAESSTMCVLPVLKGRILAPPLDVVLSSITRRFMLDMAQCCELPVEVRAITADEVKQADELLMGSANKLVTAVGKLDDREFQAPGPVATMFAEQAELVLAGKHELSSAWLTPLR